MVTLNSDDINEQYFAKGKQWYCDTYLRPFTERIWMVVLLCITIICLSVHFTSTYIFFPLNSPYPFVMYVQRDNDNLHVIKELESKHSDSTQIALAEYLVGYYVRMREEYKYQDLEMQKEYVKNNSSRTVYNNFMNYLNVHNNQNSPILQYKKDGKRAIKVLDVEVYGNGFGTNNAQVKFIASNSKTNTAKEKNIMLRFTLSDMANAVRSKSLEFRVLSYGK